MLLGVFPFFNSDYVLAVAQFPEKSLTPKTRCSSAGLVQLAILSTSSQIS